MRNSLQVKLKQTCKSERGIALPMALLLMVVAGMLVIPVLDLMTTSQKGGIGEEQQTEGLYAADAGIQDILWMYTNNSSYDLTSPYTLGSQINGMTVTISKVKTENITNGNRYSIQSIAKLNGVTKGTVTAQIEATSSGSQLDFSGIMDNAITSKDDVQIKNNCNIEGNILSGATADVGKSNVDGTQTVSNNITWPTTTQMEGYYWNQVSNLSAYTGPATGNIGPLWTNGSLQIPNNATANLTGTIYVKGTFSTKPGAIIYLNGNTIFAEDQIDFSSHPTIYGSGCIIGVNYVNFQPSLSGAPGNKLIGLDSSTTFSKSGSSGNLYLTKFVASNSGTLRIMEVYCSASASNAVKLAIYADNSGVPGKLLDKVDYGPGFDVTQSSANNWNTITMGDNATSLTAGQTYWLAVDANVGVGYQSNTTNNPSLKTAAPYSGFSFPDPATGLSSDSNNTYGLAGYDSNYILIMSITNTTYLSPNAGSFYGTLAGNSDVELWNNSTMTWVDPSGKGLDFPGAGGASGNGNSKQVKMVNYSAQ